MTTRLPIVFAAALALLLAAAAPTRAQLPPLPGGGGGLPGILGDLSGPSPCCACDPATGTRCDDLVLTGLGNNVSGCVGVNPVICAGGQLLDSTPPALLDGCACIAGNCAGPVSPDFKQFSTDVCTAQAARACGEAGGAVECACADGIDNDGNGLKDCDDPACATDPACAPCPAGQTRCNGVCVDTSSDNANCGSCGNACTGGDTCSGGVCGGGCGPGETKCNGVCTDTQTDESNCGSCANACAPGQTCTGGQCTGCETGKTDCNGTCVDLQGDEANCGACGNACGAGQTCTNGSCTGGECSQAEEACPNGKSDCCAGLQCVDNSAVDHRKVCRHGSGK